MNAHVWLKKHTRGCPVTEKVHRGEKKRKRTSGQVRRETSRGGGGSNQKIGALTGLWKRPECFFNQRREERDTTTKGKGKGKRKGLRNKRCQPNYRLSSGAGSHAPALGGNKHGV